MDPFSFQNLLNSQQPNTSFSYVSGQIPSIELSASDASVFGSQWAEDGNEHAEAVSGRKERRKWSPTKDGVLISAWLNTSKDSVVGNDQKAEAFWKRIATYFNASPKLAGMEKREGKNCKSSGQNEDDILKMTHDIYYNDHNAKFTMEHAWLELRKDQMWCASSLRKRRLA
ncbi:PREDICTED: glutathione S-transferase T3-like [Brassica oleracea var. oleracea]|uniref:No apical meristem-associated C-terminal domain-containing protein n=1 Tax=Brassica oleracea var. oleracea TaxID=109376 RepID=A0A0D3E179_BRAOL|nr:PREDICTED: glutathione S-transferase T3-like [Brassica oleracea var. oleracea]